MNLIIEKKCSIKDIQARFSEIYPFLKIEFYKFSNLGNKKNTKDNQIDPKMIFENFTNIKNPININIESSKTVLNLEKDILDQLGLYIKLFRKSNSLWIETTLTESWTLGKQNTEGELLSKPMPSRNDHSENMEDQWLEVE